MSCVGAGSTQAVAGADAFRGVGRDEDHRPLAPGAVNAERENFAQESRDPAGRKIHHRENQPPGKACGRIGAGDSRARGFHAELRAEVNSHADGRNSRAFQRRRFDHAPHANVQFREIFWRGLIHK